MTLSFTLILAYEIIIVLLMIFSAFFSSAETALVSSRRVYLETMAKKKNKGAERAISLITRQDDAISTILIGNNLVNIGATACITYLATSAFCLNEKGLFAVTAVQTLVFLLLCEMTPKIAARANPEKLLIFFSVPLKFLITVLKPVNYLAVSFTSLLKKLFHIDDTDSGPIRSRDELDLLFQIGEQEGAIDEEHHEYISGMLSFKDLTAQEVMTPTIDIVSVERKTSVRSLVQTVETTRYSRIPVFEKRVDNITGYVFYRDLMKKPDIKDIGELIYPAVYVPATKNIFQLFIEMTEKDQPLVFVVNEFGGVIGLVSHEDIAEEIVGEIQTIDHGEDSSIVKISDREYLLKGDTAVDQLKKVFEINIEKEGFETLAGFMLYRLGHIPKKGESIVQGKFLFTAEEVTDRLIKTVILSGKSKIKADI